MLFASSFFKIACFKPKLTEDNMSANAIARTSSPHSSYAVNHVQVLVQKELGKNFASFSKTPGKIDRAFSNAYSLWLRHLEHGELDSYKDPQTPAWRDHLFMPLINEGLRCDHEEDLCLLYAWVSTCRYAFRFDTCSNGNKQYQGILSAISDKLQIGNDCKKIVRLLEYLSNRNKLIQSPENREKSQLDYHGLGKLFKFLCQKYYYSFSSTLKDLNELCRATIRDIPINNSMADFEGYLNCLIVKKAAQLLPNASLEETTAFLDAFREISPFLMNQKDLGTILKSFFDEATPANVEQSILSTCPHAP